MALPAGLGFISEYLTRHGVENLVFDLSLGYSVRDLIERIASWQPDLLGYSMMTFMYHHNYQVIEAVKTTFPELPIVVGGPHVSTCRERVLEECKAINFGITLEGEKTLLELCQGKDPAKIKGLIYRKDNEIIYTGDREFIKDLDTLPFPTYQKFELQKYERAAVIVSSRGCPYSCIYCPVHLAIGRRWRARSPENVVSEFEYWYKQGIRDFSIADDNFTLLPERVFRICDLIEERNLTGLRIGLDNGIRADRVDRKLLTRMKEVGFYRLAFGVEAGNDRILKRLRKNLKIEVLEKVISDACDLGYQVILFFLLGSPGETWSDIEDSVRLMQRYPVYDAKFYNLIPFPNTDLYREIEKNNWFLREPAEYLNCASHFVNEPIFETPELPKEERQRAFIYTNKAVEEHTKIIQQRMKQDLIRRKLADFGLRGPLSRILASLYCSDWFQKLFMERKSIILLKNRLLRGV
jgi:radical SAM superfamily enzyme YgiQ (UPF0313 family)